MVNPLAKNGSGHRGIAARYIPAGAVKVADKASDALAYLYTDKHRQRPCALVYYGKQAKALAHHSYRTEAEREKSVTRYFEGRRATLARKQEHKANRLAPNKLQVGDILNTCWGYDQTNREFFEVTEVCGQFVIIREIAQAREDTCYQQWRCAPQSGKFIGEPMRKLVQYGDHITIDDVRTAHLWNTQRVAGVVVGPALYASEGH